MKLYRASNEDIGVNSDVLIFQAEDEFSALWHVRESELQNTKEYIFDDMSLNEVLRDIGKHEGSFMKYLGKRDFDEAARIFWTSYFEDDWTLEELDVPKWAKF